ncbi:hypothetical protein [Thiofilum flexile]|uniref:hypothetical protein n=1 Tax=Thiofilum flexile TaxID=125627 RepID=UPI001B7FEB2C|nr:hypothetical protein [Thiofilum flexile]
MSIASAKRVPPELIEGKTIIKPKFKLPIPPTCLSCPTLDQSKIKGKVIDPKIITPKIDQLNNIPRR